MQKLLLLPFFALIFACGDDEALQEAPEERAQSSQIGFRAHLRFLTAGMVKNRPPIKIDSRLPNGLLPKIGAAGDTIGHQTYLNGVKHGPYFDLWGPEFVQKRNGKKADGFFINGKKNGYFKRYRGPENTQYVSYYKDGEFLWAAWYGLYEMGLYPQKPLHLNEKSSVYIEAPHPNGRVWFKGLYVNGKPQGVHKFYHTNGEKRGEINYAQMTITEIWGDQAEDIRIHDLNDGSLWFSNK